MKLYFLRHGKADWPNWKKPDDERPLSKKGEKESRAVAKFLRKADIAPKLILSSPLPRAWETAEITAKVLGVKLKEETALKPDFGIREVTSILQRAKNADLMIVGHEPDFSAIIAALTGASLDLAKGGVACVEMEDSGKGTLHWLVSPKLIIR